MVFDVPFYLCMSAVDGVIDKRRKTAFKTCHNKAQALFFTGDFHLTDDPPWSSPAFCLIEERGEQANLLLGVMIQRPGLLQQTSRLLFQHRIAGLSQSIIDIVVLTPVVNLRSTEVTIPAQEDLHLGPSPPDISNQTLQDRYNLLSIRPLARSKDGRNQFPTSSFVDMKRQITGLIIVAIEHGQLLIAMCGIVSVVCIQDDGLRRTVVGVKEIVHKCSGHPIQVCSGGRVLQAGHRRLTGQIIPRDRWPLTSCFDDRITSELIAIIGILVATGYLKNPLPQHRLIRMIHQNQRSLFYRKYLQTGG